MSKMSDQHMQDMYDTIVEHEEQGCTPEEVASFLDITTEEIDRVKEYFGKE